jgi:hypothetical protein
MLDFYGLGTGLPGTPVPPGWPSIAKAARVEQAIKSDICELVPDLRPDMRFVPYVQLHEYEDCLSAIRTDSQKRSGGRILQQIS